MRYRMVPEDLIFWMTPLDGEPEATEGVLCQRHADGLTVPAGWVIDDRRDPTWRLFRPGPDEIAAAEATRDNAHSSATRPRQRGRRSASERAAQKKLPGVTPDDGAEPEPEAGDVTDGRSAPTNRADDDRVVQRRRPSPGSLLGRAFGLDER
jgi:hypothetical protein